MRNSLPPRIVADANPTFSPVSTHRVSEAIFEQIRDKILKGALKPNDRLPSERELIVQFGRSRPTIREALRMLERSGLVEINPGSRGAIIKEISARTVSQPLEGMVLQKRVSPLDLYEFRMVNEKANVQWAVERHTAEDIARMRALIREEAACGTDWPTFFAYDLRFHQAIALAGRNEMACITLEVITQSIVDIILGWFLQLTDEEKDAHRENVSRMHQAMVDAIEAREAKRALRLMDEHLQAFRELIDFTAARSAPSGG